MQMDHECISLLEGSGIYEMTSRPKTNWKGTAKKDLQRLELTWKETEAADIDMQRTVAFEYGPGVDAGWI